MLRSPLAQNCPELMSSFPPNKALQDLLDSLPAKTNQQKMTVEFGGKKAEISGGDLMQIFVANQARIERIVRGRVNPAEQEALVTECARDPTCKAIVLENLKCMIRHAPPGPASDRAQQLLQRVSQLPIQHGRASQGSASGGASGPRADVSPASRGQRQRPGR